MKLEEMIKIFDRFITSHERYLGWDMLRDRMAYEICNNNDICIFLDNALNNIQMFLNDKDKLIVYRMYLNRFKEKYGGTSQCFSELLIYRHRIKYEK